MGPGGIRKTVARYRRVEGVGGGGRAAVVLLLWCGTARARPLQDFYAGVGQHPARGKMHGAHAGQGENARAVFLQAATAAPFDKRFPLELAGVAYRMGDNAAAARHLHRALRLDPSDRYANEFLATLYYLDGNHEAALIYWNRIGKPRISSVTIEPPPVVRPSLLDGALRFASGETLSVREYRATQARLDSLDVFNRF